METLLGDPNSCLEQSPSSESRYLGLRRAVVTARNQRLHRLLLDASQDDLAIHVLEQSTRLKSQSLDRGKLLPELIITNYVSWKRHHLQDHHTKHVWSKIRATNHDTLDRDELLPEHIFKILMTSVGNVSSYKIIRQLMSGTKSKQRITVPLIETSFCRSSYSNIGMTSVGNPTR